MKTVSILFYVLTALFISACGDNDTKASTATTPEAGVVKMICECQSSQAAQTAQATQDEQASLIQGQGASSAEAEKNALEKCQVASPQSSVNNCEEITAQPESA